MRLSYPLPKGLSVVPFKGETVARLYQTNIVLVDHGAQTLTLDNGGWQTMHTKKCMNLILEAFGFSVHQKKGEWFVTNTKTGEVKPYENGQAIPLNQ